jgi:hypothetical protein
VKTVLNLSKARPKLDRLPALSAAGCCGESSCAPDDMVVIACQVLSFQADPAVVRVGDVCSCSCTVVGNEGPNSREQVMGRNNAIKPDRRCREPALWATQARPVRLLKGGKHTWVLVAARARRATKGPNDHQVEQVSIPNRRRLVDRLGARVIWAADGAREPLVY